MGTVVAMKAREPNAWSRAVGRQIKVERIAAGLTQDQVYTAAGLSPAGYKRIEAGTSVLDAIQEARILSVVKVPASAFYKRVEERIITEMRLTPEEAADLWQAILRRDTPDTEAPPTTNSDEDNGRNAAER